MSYQIPGTKDYIVIRSEDEKEKVQKWYLFLTSSSNKSRCWRGVLLLLPLLEVRVLKERLDTQSLCYLEPGKKDKVLKENLRTKKEELREILEEQKLLQEKLERLQEKQELEELRQKHKLHLLQEKVYCIIFLQVSTPMYSATTLTFNRERGGKSATSRVVGGNLGWQGMKERRPYNYNGKTNKNQRGTTSNKRGNQEDEGRISCRTPVDAQGDSSAAELRDRPPGNKLHWEDSSTWGSRTRTQRNSAGPPECRQPSEC
ncbi:RNA polymerase-associated protein CTR9 homolog [Periplaneta americana]|uniref:RNA polymerase-associated protein CTR9 homolog n=1 Tax=Periplaneta americana TaxID=6978 RepID=UPI0037E84FFB